MGLIRFQSERVLVSPLTRLWHRALTPTAVAVLAGAAAELTGQGRLPFDHLRWHVGSPEILIDDRWLPLRAVQNISVNVLVTDEIAAEGPAFADHFAVDLERLVERRGSRWGSIIALDVEDGGNVHRVNRLVTHFRGRALVRKLTERTELTGEREEFALPPRIDGARSWSNLTRDAANKDLGVLAWHLAHRLASPRTHVPWREGLTAIQSGLGSGISRRDFAIQLMSVLALFGDGHVRLKRAESHIELSKRAVPVRFVAVNEGVACMTADGRRFYSQKYPLLLAIDGLPLDSIFHALAPLVPYVSSDFQRSEVLDLARNIELLHGLAGSTNGETSTLLLGDGKGRQVNQVVRCEPEIPEPRLTSIDVRVLPSGDGYLALRGGWPGGESFAKKIDSAFHVFCNTQGLIIDVRGNRGGNRESVLHLLRHILPPDDRIIDIAAYRMDEEERPPVSLDVLAGRGLHAPTERDEPRLAAVRTRWILPPTEWSEWHVARLDTKRPELTYDGPILILVDERSASATALLTSVLAPLDRVTIAGLAGGGGGGWPIEVRLPKSGLIVSLPSMFSVEPTGTERSAVVPEVRYPRTVDDLEREIAGDPIPSWALTVLRSGTRAVWPMESGTTGSPRTK